MKISVCVIVYNRIENLQRWLHCWEQCDKTNASLTVIHNYEKVEDVVIYNNLCKGYADVTYIQRQNIGYDIGAFQDVCLERLYKFDNDWDYLLWCTDDTIPMSRDFVQKFLNVTQVGSPVMHISSEVTDHVRTTGFRISKRVSKSLTFPSDRVTSKQECYHFEHLGGRKTLFHQLRSLGEEAFMISNLANSPLWDIGHRKSIKLRRMQEHDKAFYYAEEVSAKLNVPYYEPKKIGDKVAVICTIYNAFPDVIGSMLAQTHKNWVLYLVHDGKSDGTINIQGIVDAVNDTRIIYIETPERAGYWGHTIRRDYLQNLRNTDFDFVLITNHDNHHVPSFLQKMITPLMDGKYFASFCSEMVHSYVDHKVMICRLKRGHVDCAGVVIRKDIACEIGFVHVHEHSADWFYFQDIINKYGDKKFVRVQGCLLVHN